MATYTVNFEIDPPADATTQEVEEWLEFQLGVRGGVNKSNPLAEHDIDCVEGLTVY